MQSSVVKKQQSKTTMLECCTASVDRIEVIDHRGRVCVHHYSDLQLVEFKLQDDRKTLKLFVKHK